MHGGTMAVQQRILVIDDEDDVGELVSATAQMMGFQCTATGDPETFLEKLAPDTTLIVLDLMMPQLDGIEVLRLLGKRKCKAGIVLMSGVGKRTIESAGQLAQVLGLSIVGHLQKPFQLSDLQEILQRFPSSGAPSVIQSSPQFAIQREELQSAIQYNEFVVHYEPQIDLASGRVLGVEALARWQHPELGLILPENFIGQMEKFGLIEELDWIVANLGMSEVGQFANDDGTSCTLSLNASVHSLYDLSFPDTLVSIAGKHGVSPGDITIEITESGLIKELSRTLDILTRLRIKQVKLSIDDFGSGYATMQQFKNIPATELKIDRSFVQGMMNIDSDRIVVQKTIEMGHELGMKVTAEGVERQDQLDLLCSNDCDNAQGYLFSRPIPAGEMVNWLKAYRTRLAH
jgi:EAL domain-containing protein (putative c-di-GMP-specific phosphodiesterase class I)/CheY-like chemotaxis protein